MGSFYEVMRRQGISHRSFVRLDAWLDWLLPASRPVAEPDPASQAPARESEAELRARIAPLEALLTVRP